MEADAAWRPRQGTGPAALESRDQQLSNAAGLVVCGGHHPKNSVSFFTLQARTLRYTGTLASDTDTEAWPRAVTF